jgi:hypothetical protein
MLASPSTPAATPDILKVSCPLVFPAEATVGVGAKVAVKVAFMQPDVALAGTVAFAESVKSAH